MSETERFFSKVATSFISIRGVVVFIVEVLVVFAGEVTSGVFACVVDSNDAIVCSVVIISAVVSGCVWVVVCIDDGVAGVGVVVAVLSLEVIVVILDVDVEEVVAACVVVVVKGGCDCVVDVVELDVVAACVC